MAWGVALSANNSAFLGFHSDSSGAATNYASMSLYAKDDIMTWTGNGFVGIGVTTPPVLLTVQNTISTDFNSMLNVLAPSASNGVHTAGIYFGRARSTDELGWLTFVPSASAQLAQIRIGMWGRDDLVNIEGTGKVGIGETSPGSKLSVSGNATIGASYDTTAAPTNGLLVEGNLGIGTTTFSNLLSVHGNGYISSNLFVGGSITSTSSLLMTSTTATSTFSGGVYVAQTASSTAPYIYSKTAGFGGHFIMEDEGGTSCTEYTSRTGAAGLRATVITCPTEI